MDTSEQPSINGSFVNDDAVFLIVTCEAGNGDDGVAAQGDLLDGGVFAELGRYEGFLRVVHEVGVGVGPQLAIQAVQAHCLLDHCALEGVLGGLVVVGEGDHGGAHSEHH